MLRVVRGPGHAGNNSEDRAEAIVHTVNRVRHPTAAASMPAFAFQNCVEGTLGALRLRHRIQGAGVRFFFERACPQKILHILLVGQGALALGTELPLVFLLRRFHAANRDVGAERARETPLKPRPDVVG